MSDWRQQEECEERQQWELERRVQKLEIQLPRTRALIQILEAEKAAIEPQQQERKYGDHRNR